MSQFMGMGNALKILKIASVIWELSIAKEMFRS